jgi:hypothetical protein
VHFAVGYRNTEHLLPAVMGALLFAVGMALSLEPTNRSVFRPTD